MASAYKYQGKKGRGSLPIEPGCHCWRCQEAHSNSILAIRVAFASIGGLITLVAFAY